MEKMNSNIVLENMQTEHYIDKIRNLYGLEMANKVKTLLIKGHLGLGILQILIGETSTQILEPQNEFIYKSR